MHTKISCPMDYKVGLYIRLSKEDEGEVESQSVTNQRSLLENFVQENRLDVFSEYIDDGYSGTNFHRPAFTRMISDIEAKKVNMVITKDLSRLGRDYILTGHYMERYFPENHVRYISILDGIDTGIESTANDITPFRAIMNDMYAKDISKKIRSVKHDKQRKGLFIGGKAAYGYKISPDEKNKLIIDDNVASIVEQIFAYAMEGKSCREIAVILNKQKIMPPAVYANLNLARQGPYSGLWSSERISDMLQNQVYIGNMTQGKTKKISYKSEKCIKVNRNDWIIVENTHQPIIDKEMFNKVQILIASRKNTRKRIYDYPLKGIIYCHECGYPLGVINRPNAAGEDVLYLICRTYQRFTKANVCTSHSIKEKTVTDAVLEKIAEVCQDFLQKNQLLATGLVAYDQLSCIGNEDNDLEIAEAKIATISANMDRIYMDKLSGLLQESDFVRLYSRLKDERLGLEQKIINIKSKQVQSPKQKHDHLKKLVEKFLDTKHHNRDLLLSLVEKVELTATKEIIIHFKCSEMGNSIAYNK